MSRVEFRVLESQSVRYPDIGFGRCIVADIFSCVHYSCAIDTIFKHSKISTFSVFCPVTMLIFFDDFHLCCPGN